MNQADFTDFLATLQRHAQARPDAIAIADGTREISYRKFAADIDKVARRLHSYGLAPGSRAILFFRSQYLHWLAALALMRLGVVTISLYDLSQQDLLQMLGAHALVTEHGNLKADMRGMISMGEDWLEADADSWPALPERPYDPRQAVRILLSSGTTGLPKKIQFDNGITDARIGSTMENYGFAPHHRFMSGVGLDTVGGYTFALVAWAAGGSVAFYDATLPLGLQLDQTRANLLFMSPVQVANSVEILAPEFRHPGLTMIVGGGRLPQAVAERAHARLASTIWIVYGSTEAGTVAKTFTPDYSRPESVGTRVANAQVQIVDEAGRPVAPGMVGEVRTRGPCCIDAYLEDTETSSAYFRDGWFYPGDLGALSAADELSIVGRVGDVMNLGGVKVTPGAIEDALEACPGVQDLAAFSVPDELGVETLWVAVRAGEGYAEEALRHRYAERFPNRQAPCIALVASIPRNAMSKVLRNQLRETVKQSVKQGLLEQWASAPVVISGSGSANHADATENMESKVTTVKINDKDYELEQLSDEVKSQLASVQFIDAELQRIGMQRAALQTARAAYMRAVGEALNK